MHRHGNVQYDEIDATGVLLLIVFQFRKIFEKNDQLLRTLKYIDTILKDTQNSHFIQGSLWHQKIESF